MMHAPYRYCIGILLFFLWQTCVYAQEDNYRFRTLGVQQGLVGSGVIEILEDKYGFIWIGTESGLNRFDGYEVKNYTTETHGESGLASDLINALTTDAEGNLWVGTNNYGLFKFQQDKQKFKHITFEESHLDKERINSLFLDQQGYLWIGTQTQGLIRYDKQKHIYKQFLHNPQTNSLSNNNVRGIGQDRQGYLWISTNGGGLNRLDKAGKFQCFNSKTHALPADFLKKIYTDRQGELWIGSSKGGLIRCNPQTMTFKMYRYAAGKEQGLPSDEVYSIGEDAQGNIWVGTWNKGLAVLDRQKETFRTYAKNPDKSQSLPDDVITTVFRDKTDRMWLGTYYGGACYFSPREHLFTRFDHDSKNIHSISDNSITSVLEDSEGLVWIGTQGQGVNIYNPQNRQFSLYKADKDNPTALANNTAWCMLEDNEKRVWLGTSGGLHVFDKQRKQFQRFQHNPKDSNSLSNNNVFCLTQDKAGYIWVGTWYGGLNRFDPKTGKFTKIIKGNTSIKSVWADKQKRLWVASQTGILCYNTERDTWITLSDTKDSLLRSTVNSFREDKKGNIWVATSGKGLLYFDEQKQCFRPHPHAHTLPKNIGGFCEDAQGNFWLTSSKGLIYFNTQKATSLAYDTEDGLKSIDLNGAAIFVGKGDKMYFGSYDGLNVFEPQKLLQQTALPTPIFTAFLVFNKPVTGQAHGRFPFPDFITNAKSVTLYPNEFMFAFEYAAAHTHSPQKVQYAYQLVGFERDWVYTTAKDRKAVYTNVPFGFYKLRVKAGVNGVWNEQYIEIDIVLQPHWWETLTAKIAFLLLVLGSIFTFYQVRINFIQRQKQKLEAQVIARTEEIVQQKEEIYAQAEELKAINQQMADLDKFKQNMTGMIVHDLKNPLNALLNISPEKVTDYGAQIQYHTRQMQNLIINMLDVQKFEEAQMVFDKTTFALDDVVAEALLQVDFLCKQKNIHIEQKFEVTISVQADYEILLRVVVNLLTNAIKYSGFNKKIVLAIHEKDTQAYFEIQDEGIGIPTDKLEAVFDKFVQIEAKNSGGMRSTGLGLTYCKMAIEAHGGNIGVHSEEGKGSAFWFTLPKISSQAGKDKAEIIPPTAQTIILTAADKEILAPFLPTLQAMQVYYSTELQRALATLPTTKSPTLIAWEARLKEAIFAMNQELYEKILHEAVSL